MIYFCKRSNELYIKPLTEEFKSKDITFWLDTVEINWGDSIVMKVNQGLTDSKFVLLCLSRAYLNRPWPEAEMGAALSIQNTKGVKSVLPLILNSKDDVLALYPLLAGIKYREFSAGVSTIADEISNLCGPMQRQKGEIQITVESIHTGKLCNIISNPNVSVKWLVDRAKAGMGVTDLAETGAYEKFHLRWVLVDICAEAEWQQIPRFKQQTLRALISTEKGVVYSISDLDHLVELGIRDGAVFHLYAIEDVDHRSPPAFPNPKE